MEKFAAAAVDFLMSRYDAATVSRLLALLGEKMEVGSAGWKQQNDLFAAISSHARVAA